MRARCAEECFDCTLGYEGEGPGSRAAPRQARRTLPGGTDLRVTVSTATARRYIDMLDRFDRWMRTVGLGTLASISNSPEKVNAALTAYLQLLFDDQMPFSWGSNLLAGVQFLYPALRAQLTPSWSAQRKWINSVAHDLRPPVPEELLLAVAVVFVLYGWHRSAILLLVGHHAMLRPAEMGRIRRGHLCLPSDFGGVPGRGALSIAESKTATRASRIQSVILDDPTIVEALESLWCNANTHACMCPGGVSGLGARFAHAKDVLGLRSSPYTLGGLRGGGAVAHFQRHQNLGLLQFRGRWETQRSLQHYLQEGFGLLQFARLPSDARELVRHLASLAPMIIPPSLANCNGSD